MRFDNSDSLLRGKKLSYWVEVLEPLRDDEMAAYRVEGECDGSEFDWLDRYTVVKHIFARTK